MWRKARRISFPITACAALAVGCGMATRDPDGSLGTSGGAQTAAGGASSAGAAAGGGGPASASGGRSTELRGLFQLAALDDDGIPGPVFRLGGFVTRGPIWDGPPRRAAMQEGGCRLLVPDEDGCSGGCAAGAACNRDGECALYPPAYVDVGPVRIFGLASGDQVLGIGVFVAQYGGVADDPPCEEGAALRLESSVFSLATPCIGVVTTAGHPLVSFRAGEPATVTWDPPQVPGISRIEIFFQLSKDRDSPFDILCDAPDTGSFVVPEALVTRAFELGISFYPDTEITRVSVPDPEQPAGFAFEMRSWKESSLDTGVAYCTEDSDCPEGLVCRTWPMFTCESP